MGVFAGKNNRGYSLIEMVLVIAIIGLLAPVIVTPLTDNAKGWIDVLNRNDINDDARSVMDRMVRELRNTRRRADNAPSITVAESARIAVENMNAESVVFSWGGVALVSDLQRGPDVLVPGSEVSSFAISYFDDNNNRLESFPLSLADRNAVRRILIFMDIVKGNDNMRVQRQVHVRSLSGF